MKFGKLTLRFFDYLTKRRNFLELFSYFSLVNNGKHHHDITQSK